MQLTKINAELATNQQRIARMRDGPGKTALRQKAMKVLQRRKMYETQKDQLEQQSWNMQQAGMMQDNLKSRCLPTLELVSFAVLLPLLLPLRLGAFAAAVGAITAWAMLMRRRRPRADVMVTVDAMKTPFAMACAR